MARIDHSTHNHPATPKARAACRAAGTAAVVVPTLPLVRVGRGDSVHVAVLGTDGSAYAARCGAGYGRGVRRNSAIYRLATDGTMADVTCTRCTKIAG